MDSGNGWKAVSFANDSYSFMKIVSMGYRDYSVRRSGDFITVNRWHCLYFVSGGSGSFAVNGKTHALRKGDMFFIRPGEQVAYCTDDDTLKYYWIAISEEHAEEIAEILSLGRDTPVRATKYAQRVEWIFTSAVDWEKATSKSYFSAISALMQILSAECEAEAIPRSAEKHKMLAESIKQTIDLNFKKTDFS
ncbi:MAG: AraC family ligand binding domain-containing protein, partial [Oscillospiraceae bacterium]|nr:AraC family ligand binding domain-containing protein [Oscillospiraceae bacterium]